MPTIGGGRGQWLGGTMASAEHEPITGVWGSRGRAPGQGVRGAKPAKAESILVIGCPTEPANLAPFLKCLFELRYTQQSLTENSMLCYGQLVLELGGRVYGAPNPGGGLCPPPPAPGSAAYDANAAVRNAVTN